jgi:hypothetical protein
VEQPVVSEAITWASGGKKVIPLDFLPRKGPRGGRFVVDKVIVDSHLNVSGTTVLSGPDQSSFIKRGRIYDRKGNRRYLTGYKLRAKAFIDQRDRVPADPSTSTNPSAADLHFYHVFTFLYPFADEKERCCIPADALLDGGGIEIQMPTSSDLIVESGTPTINSGDYTAYVYGHEDFGPARDYVRDVVEEFTPPASSKNFYVPVGGGLLRDVTFLKDAAGGGTSLGAFNITIDRLQIVNQPATINKIAHLMGGNVASGDPVSGGFAIPIIIPKNGQRAGDFPYFEGQMMIRSDTSLTTEVMVTRDEPEDETFTERLLAANGHVGHKAAAMHVENTKTGSTAPRSAPKGKIDWSKFSVRRAAH